MSKSSSVAVLCLYVGSLRLIISPEHEVLKVSYCGQSMSVVRRASCGVNNCFKGLTSYTPGPFDSKLGRKHGVNCR